MTLSVWIPDAPGGEFLPALRRCLGDAAIVHVGPDGPAAAQVLVEGVPSDAQLDACTGLELVVIPYAGLQDKIRERLARRPGLRVHNIHHNAAPTAELAVGLLIAAARLLVPFDRCLRLGDWRPRYTEPPPSRTLAGKRALVLGFGAIGQRVARTLLAMDLEVVASSRHGRAEPALPDVAVSDRLQLDAALTDVEVLMVCLPATRETDRLIDARRLELLAPGALLVNVGRGRIVDEGALYAALESGRLGGAGLDVWYRYPRAEAERTGTLPASQPFHDLDTVVLSPHRGGLTRENETHRARDVAALILQHAGGVTPDNAVDLHTGY